MNILIQSIPHENQRYETAGDWEYEDGVYQIRVSEMPDARYEFLLGFHEAIEAVLCINKGVTTEMVDRFDFNFKGKGEPGDSPKAPYRNQHFFATNIERLIAEKLGVDWLEYEKAIDNLFKEKKHVAKTKTRSGQQRNRKARLPTHVTRGGRGGV